MTNHARKIEAKREAIVFPSFALKDRPAECPLAGHGHPASHWISVHETLVPCVVTKP